MTTIDNVSSALSEADHRAQLCRAVIASTVGTTIAWYDFFLYGLVTGLVFGKLFFPSSDPLVGVLQAFAIYAVGFVARPVGAAIFGHYGDRMGRKAALITTLLMTGLATFAVGFVPTYEQIGIWGAVILTIVRFIQVSGSAANGAARCCFRWNGRARTPTAGLSRHGRNSARPPGFSWRIWRCWCSPRSPATSFSAGDGVSRSSSASSWSGSAFISGWEYSRPRSSRGCWPTTGSNGPRYS